MVTTEETRRGIQEENIVLPPGKATRIVAETGPVTLRALEDASIRVETGGPASSVLLRVSEAIELYDGDLVCAGRQWMAFHAGPGRLHLLDGEGGIHMGITLRGTAVSIGRDVGDVVLPWDDSLAEMHLQLLIRRDGTFLQDLDSAGGTWVVVQPGEVVPSGSVLAIGERVLRVVAAEGGGRPHLADHRRVRGGVTPRERAASSCGRCPAPRASRPGTRAAACSPHRAWPARRS
jgi:hypothetical protein